MPALVDLVKDVVGALALGFEKLVEGHDGKARQGQAEEQPGLERPELRYLLHGDMKQRAQQPAGDAGDAGQQQPLGDGAAIENSLGQADLEILFQNVGHGRGLLSVLAEGG